MQITNNTSENQSEKLPSEVLGIPQDMWADDGEHDPSPKRNIVDQLLDLAQTCEHWHTPSGIPYVSIPNEGHRGHYRVDSSFFNQWLRHEFYKETGKGVSAESMKQAISTISAMARFDGETYEVFLRIAQDGDGSLWIDLCDDAWQAVHVTKDGWAVEAEPTLRFIRHSGMEAIPIPQHGSIEQLWPLIHCDPEDRIIIAGFLLNALHPSGPYFGLNLFGSKGSAKSTATRIIRSLIDPNEAFSQTMPTSGENLALAAQGQRLLAFENLSKVSDEESDWLCRLSTGDAIRRRTLYADSEETIFRAKRPWIVNGIPNLVSRGDLIDRALSVELLPIDRRERKEENSINENFERVAPQIFGALLNGLSHAISTMDEIRPSYTGQLPRMADVALWITAAEPALGFDRGCFLRRQQEIAAESSADAADGNCVAATIIRLAGQSGEWKGLMKDLLKEIENDHPGDRFVPQSPRALGNAINRIKTDLWEAHDIRVEKLTRQAAGVPVRIWKEVHDIHNLHPSQPGVAGRDVLLSNIPAEQHRDLHLEIPQHHYIAE